MDYEKAYKESMRRTREFVERGSMTVDFAKAIFDDFEIENEGEIIRKQLIEYFTGWRDGTKFREIPVEKVLKWLEKQVPPKWLYRLEYKDGTCGLWYNGEGKWCFEQGIGSVEGCKTKGLPMDHDERYKQDGRDWFSSCSNKEDLLHWYSLDDAEKLIKKGFVFTRYLSTEYHEYENETVFIKESSLVREEIDIFELFGKTKPMFKEGDWIIYKDDWTGEEDVLVVSNPDPNGTSLYTVKGQQKYYLDWNSLKTARLWTINDVISGDVLVASDGSIFLCNDYDDHGVKYFVSLTKDGKLNISDGTHYWETARSCHPATKEERNLLFAKIKEEGYEWDDKRLAFLKMEKDENLDFAINLLQGIVDRNEGEYSEKVKASIEYIKDLAKGDRSKCLMSALQEANKKIGELVDENYYLKNPKDGIWHDGKDDKVKEDIKYILANSDLSKVSTPYSDILDWMDDKDRLVIYLKEANKKKQELANENFYLKNQNKNEWSEEDKKNYKEILTHLKVQGNSATLDVNRAKWRKLESWFKTRYPKFPKENSVDKEKIEKLIEACERAQDDFPQLSAEYTEIEELKEWLKYFNGDKWQPSMDQLDALQFAIESAEHEREYTEYDNLVSLMEDLKKL